MTCIETIGNLSATSHLPVSQERFPNSLSAWLPIRYLLIRIALETVSLFSSPCQALDQCRRAKKAGEQRKSEQAKNCVKKERESL